MVALQAYTNDGTPTDNSRRLGLGLTNGDDTGHVSQSSSILALARQRSLNALTTNLPITAPPQHLNNKKSLLTPSYSDTKLQTTTIGGGGQY